MIKLAQLARIIGAITQFIIILEVTRSYALLVPCMESLKASIDSCLFDFLPTLVASGNYKSLISVKDSSYPGLWMIHLFYLFIGNLYLC